MSRSAGKEQTGVEARTEKARGLALRPLPLAPQNRRQCPRMDGRSWWLPAVAGPGDLMQWATITAEGEVDSESFAERMPGSHAVEIGVSRRGQVLGVMGVGLHRREAVCAGHS